MAAVMVECESTYLNVLECKCYEKRSMVFNKTSVECHIDAGNGK